MAKLLKEFTLDSNGHCLICLVKPKSEGRNPSPSGSSSSLQELSHYLNLDLAKLFHANGDHHHLQLFPNVGLNATLCEECASIQQELYKLYLQQVQIEIEMATRLQLFQRKLFNFDNASRAEFMSSLSGTNKRGELKLVEDLRMEVLGKCFLKLASFPATPTVSEEITPDGTGNGGNALTSSISDATSSQKKSSKSPAVRKEKNLPKCDVCGKEFYHQPSLAAHHLTHTDTAEVKPGSTDKPNNTTWIRRNLKRNSNVSCRRCKLVFHSFRPFRKHLKRVHLPPTYTLDATTGDLKCDLCLIEFSNNGQLQEHFNLHLSQRRKCVECEGEFENDTFFQLHYQRVHQENSQFRCGYCGKIMANSECYEKHIKKCKAANILSCRRCKKGFRSTSEFRTHFKLFHETTGVVECGICFKYFKLPQDLETHRLAKHPPVEIEDRNYHVIEEWWDD